jgi:small subunit ribosomal protein S11e
VVRTYYPSYSPECREAQTSALGGKKLTKEKRWYKDVGLGYKTPSEAISGTYIGA